MSHFDENDAFEGASLSQRAIAARDRANKQTKQKYLADLNPAQRQAVETLDGPVLMLAGAGTGKTKSLMARIAHLIRENKARPDEILAVTFTNKAAQEMKTRLAVRPFEIDEPIRWMGTFHSICVKLLRRHAELISVDVEAPQGGMERSLHLKSNFTILDTDDQIRLLKQLIRANNIDEKRWPPRQLASIIDNWKNRAWTPEQVPAAEASAFNHRGTELYDQYQRRLIELNAVDFGDLLLHMVTIFQKYDDILERYRRWFRYILVDEYQDTNVAQYLWLRLLAGGHKNICCVGDDDQSIYGWRGAEVGNILRFEQDFPGAKVIRLEQNYRSTPHILAAASNVIKGNEGRLGKTLWTAAKAGEMVQLIGHWDGEAEAIWIGEKIEDHRAGRSEEARRRANPRMRQAIKEIERLDESGALRGANSADELVGKLSEHAGFLANEENRDLLWELKTRREEGLSLEPPFLRFNLYEIAILVRASHQMRAFEDRFLTIGLPYRVIGGPRFYERMEIRDAMAYFRVVTSPSDDLAFERIVNTPKRGLGDKAQQTIQAVARANRVSLLEGARLALADGLIKGKGGANLRQLVDDLGRWNGMTRGPVLAFGDASDDVLDDGAGQPQYGDPNVSHVELAQIILDESGYTTMWQNDKTPEAPGRLENLKELVKALEQFENLQGFLEHVSLIMDNEQGEGDEKVSIMTLHAAKGLEFPVVFLPGWEDGLFPSQRSMDETGLKGLEEERRLAYVGITRAEELCTISFASNRRVFGQWQSQMPSRFVDELPDDHVDVLTPPGLYGGGYGAARPASGVEARAAEADGYDSPGWKRMQERASRRPVASSRSNRNVTIDATAVAAFEVGARVFHQKFGYGNVVDVDGDKLDIEFDKAGSKRVVSRFVTADDDI